jgi:hypothetical protein
LIAGWAGVALAIGVSMVALALSHAGKDHPPPLLLSAVWTLAAAISFCSAIAYLLIEPKRRELFVVQSRPQRCSWPFCFC